MLSESLRASANRQTEAWQLIPVTVHYLQEALGCAAQFLRFDGRAKAYVQVDPPRQIAELLLAKRGAWKLPELAGVINTPFLRADGSICETPGYDLQSKLLFKPEAQVFPAVPASPGKTDAEAALGEFKALLEEFPFPTPADRSVALAGLLTIVDRRSMDTAPLFGFTAPAAGTGKSLLVDLMSIIATGRRMPVMSAGKSEEEFEKRLGAALIAGDMAISIDNCDADLGGALLCQCLTQGELNVRQLGHSRYVGVVTSATFYATGNNLTLIGDLTRRALLCSLDAGMERPELRTFKRDVVKIAFDRRNELVIAGLTILRAWHLAKLAGESVRADTFGGFEQWSSRVREALIWLGQADPCETIGNVRDRDPAREQLGAVLEQWNQHLRIGERYSVKDVIETAISAPLFHAALMNVAGGQGTLMVSPERLGRWLKKVNGKIVRQLSLHHTGILNGFSMWKLQ